MKFATCFYLLLAFLSGPAFAHSPLQSTSPADGAVLDTPPDTIRLTFAKPARLTKLTLTYEGEERRLELTKKSFAKEVMVDPGSAGGGKFLVGWRALGTDGHVLKGEFSYTVKSTD